VEPGGESLILRPIGHVRTAKRLKFDAPHQPDADAEETNRIELLSGSEFERALDDLAGFERIWLVWWFHRNASWRPRVLPPRGPAKRRGVFATRSPHRPNPLGLTCVRLLGVQGRVLTVGPLDLVDGTPILDVKPYLPQVDAFPGSKAGWIDEIDAELAGRERYEIEVQPLAARQLAYLRDAWDVDFTERAFGILGLDPTPHRTRRILRVDDRLLRLACGPWRLYYTLEGRRVSVESIASGYADSIHAEAPDRAAHAAFVQRVFGDA